MTESLKALARLGAVFPRSMRYDELPNRTLKGIIDTSTSQMKDWAREIGNYATRKYLEGLKIKNVPQALRGKFSWLRSIRVMTNDSVVPMPPEYEEVNPFYFLSPNMRRIVGTYTISTSGAPRKQVANFERSIRRSGIPRDITPSSVIDVLMKPGISAEPLAMAQALIAMGADASSAGAIVQNFATDISDFSLLAQGQAVSYGDILANLNMTDENLQAFVNMSHAGMPEQSKFAYLVKITTNMMVVLRAAAGSPIRRAFAVDATGTAYRDAVQGLGATSRAFPPHAIELHTNELDSLGLKGY